MKDSLIVVSGGMDSITLLYEYADRIALAVSFDYGANHNHKEIPFARIHCERLKIKHIVIPLAFMKEYFRSSLLDGSDSVPEGHYADENMKSTVVPFRNGIMLSVACGIAESNGLKQVLIANHGGDHAIYPDCRSEFIQAMDKATRSGTYENIGILCSLYRYFKNRNCQSGEKVEFELCRNVVLLQRRGETLREMRYLCRTQRGSSGCRD